VWAWAHGQTHIFIKRVKLHADKIQDVISESPSSDARPNDEF